MVKQLLQSKKTERMFKITFVLLIIYFCRRTTRICSRTSLILVYTRICDIAKNLLSLTELFADDSSLFYVAPNTADLAGISNYDLQLLSNWAR